jgi:hypothetical protein
MRKYLNQDSINSAREKCVVCAQFAEFASVMAIPFFVIWLVNAGMS